MARCEEWGVGFAASEGGICRSCGRLLCRKHLVISLHKGIRLRDTPPPRLFIATRVCPIVNLFGFDKIG